MSTDYPARAKQVEAQTAALFKAAPEVMRNFRSVMTEASKPGTLDSATKELMALAIAIATHCSGCILYHVRQAMKHGVSREAVVETIAVTVEMGGGPATVYGGEALAAYDAFAAEKG